LISGEGFEPSTFRA